MAEIKLAKWRYFLTFFILLTSARLAVDCLYKLGIPFRDVFVLILKDALLPAIIVAALLFHDWTRNR
jgi:hypothetical protein